MNKTFPAGSVKRIHINQHIIKANKKGGPVRPVITVQTSEGPFRGSKVVVNGRSELVYRPENPLSCGAHVWMETTDEVVVENCIKSTKSNAR